MRRLQVIHERVAQPRDEDPTAHEEKAAEGSTDL